MHPGPPRPAWPTGTPAVSRRARIICLALSQPEGLPTCVYIHRLAMPRARHDWGQLDKNTRPCRGSNRVVPAPPSEI